jgi:anti-sigma factor RsiW
MHPREPVLQAYYDGELDAVTSAMIREHCAACPTCRADLATRAFIRERVAKSAPRATHASVWPHIAARPRREQSRSHRLAFDLGITAAAVAGVVLGVLIGAPASNDSAVDESSSRHTVADLWPGGGYPSLLNVFDGE